MKKYLYIVLGSVFLGLAVLGIFLPLLPTTPFLLLTATCYLKGSQKLYDWLIGHPKLGTYILNYREHKIIPLKVKVYTISLLWVTILTSAFVFIDLWWLRIVLFAIATGVTIHVLSFKN